jgi:hypothetical protein
VTPFIIILVCPLLIGRIPDVIVQTPSKLVVQVRLAPPAENDALTKASSSGPLLIAYNLILTVVFQVVGVTFTVLIDLSTLTDMILNGLLGLVETGGGEGAGGKGLVIGGT